MFSLQVDCPFFLEYEKRIKRLTQSINSRKLVSKKVDKAQELLDITNILSNCPRYNEEKENCESCHFILHLKKEIARTIIKATEAIG